MHLMIPLGEPTYRCRRVAVDADAVERSVRLFAQEFPHLFAGDLEARGDRGEGTGDQGQRTGDRTRGTEDRGHGIETGDWGRRIEVRGQGTGDQG